MGMGERLHLFFRKHSTRLVVVCISMCASIYACAQPANDNPCNAIALPVNIGCVTTNGTVQNATGSGVAAPSCGSGNQDVWYTVTVPASGNLMVNTAPGSSNALTDGGMAFYTVGACGTVASFAQIACNDDQVFFFNQMPQISVSCRTAGSTIYVRIWKQSGGGNSRNFTICATDPGTGPANDDPCGAVPLTVNTACTNTTANNTLACPSNVANPSCAGYSGGDVWFSVVVPSGGTLTFTGSVNGASALTDGGMAVYSATNCANPATFNQLACDDNNGPGNMPALTLSGQTPGQTLYVRFWENGNNAFGTFNLCVTMPLANNDPCGAITVPVTSNCSYSAYSNTGATNSSTTPAAGCGSFGAGSLDVWFSFTVPASGIAIIETTAGTMTDAAMALYSANACNGTFTLIQCDDDNGPGLMPFLSFTGLTPGATYYLRYWGYNGGSGTFNLCIHGPSAVPAGQCVYVLQLYDTGNNGWGSSSVGISINGGPYTNYTVTSSYDIALIGVNIGNVVVVQYTSTGPNQTQNHYTLSLLSGGGLIFNSGSPPAAGIAFAQTVTCLPPPAPANDCAGGNTICGGQSFNNNSSGTGNVVDLNSSNQGCLASGERQGTWYRFSPSAAGTIGFTIAPVVTTDYDFALWGPLASVQCPPIGPPLRCSYSGLTGNTGLGNGAVDLSEGAGGDKWVQTITVTPGQIYILYVDNFSANGQSFSLTWQLTNGAALDCTVLPIELTSFTASSSDAGIDLRWATSSEENNDRFEIERSVDDVLFVPIGSLPGAGNSAHDLRYMFTDREPTYGLNYYRLKQVDFDGQYEFSPVVSAVWRKSGEVLLVFPNPGSDLVNIVVPHSAPGAMFTVADATGRELRRAPISAEHITFDASSLPLGVYSFNVSTSDGASLTQVMWVKE